MQLLKHVENTWWNSRDAVIKVVPRTDATTRPLTGRWVDIVHDDGERTARWKTRGYEQTLNGNEELFSATPATIHLKNDVGRCSSERTRGGSRGLQWSLLPGALEPQRTESKVWIEPPPEADLGPDYLWEAVSAFLGPKGAPRAWDTFGAKVLTSCNNHDSTVAFSTDLNHLESTSRRKQAGTAMTS